MGESPEEPATSIPESIARLCDQLADSVYVMDADGVIRYANAAFEKMTGYTPEEAVGQSASILASGSHPDAVYADMWATLRAGEPFRLVFSNRRKDGTPYDEGAMISPLHDTESGETFYLLVGRLIKFTRQNYDVFTILANSAPAGIYLQRDGILYFVNDRLASLLGRPASVLVGSPWIDLVVPEDRERVLSQIADAGRGGTSSELPFECRIPTPDGGVRWVMASVQPILLSGTTAMSGEFFAGYVVDITARKLAEERLRNAISLHAATIESTTDGIVVIDQSRNIVSYNRRFAEIWKLNPLAADPNEMRRVMASQLADPEAFQEMLLQTRQDPTIEEMVTVDLVDGRHMELYSKPQIVDGEVVGRVWSWRDITERRRFESALIRLANFDSLTGLMNRRKIQEELEACMSGTGRARGALLLLDLDGFKEVNDTFGHQAGDEVLLQVGRVLADSDVGDLIGRFGGDEFAILLPGVTQAEALRAAERILHHLSDHTYIARGGKVMLTGSMGVAFYPGHARTSDELLSAADLALYEAKSQNHSSLHVYSSRLQRNSRLQRRGDWQAQLGNAISNGKGKLYAEKTLPLQDKLAPIYRLTIRLTGSRTHVLSSRDLGGLARQPSLTLALDRWLLRETISLARRPSFIATAAGLSFQLSVHSLAHPDIVRRLLDLSALRASHDNPLVLELTDLESVASAKNAIAILRSAGYRFEAPERDGRKLAQIMATLPVDYLRLDSSIVGDLDANLGVLPLIEGALHTAKRLGAASIAEGVPNQDILNMLRDLGLEYARGPAIGPARSANSVFRIAGRGLQAA